MVESRKRRYVQGKQVNVRWKAAVEVEDRRSYITLSDVLRPHALPDDDQVRAYAAELADAGHPVAFRTGDSRGRLQLFSSPEGRRLLEQQLLLAGLRVRGACPQLNGLQRPLGYTRLHTLGFGTMFATYRNSPNNAPLALSAGDRGSVATPEDELRNDCRVYVRAECVVFRKTSERWGGLSNMAGGFFIRIGETVVPPPPACARRLQLRTGQKFSG